MPHMVQKAAQAGVGGSGVRVLPDGLSQERFRITGTSQARPPDNSGGGSEGHADEEVKDHSQGTGR